MSSVKKMLLMILGVIIFIIFVGLITQSNRGQSNFLTNIFKQQNSLVGLTMKKMAVGSHQLDVAIADTQAKQQKWLGGVTSLSDNQGMLFDFSKQNIRPTFWMKDMKIPIDIIWIKAGKIIQIDKAAQPPALNIPDTSL